MRRSRILAALIACLVAAASCPARAAPPDEVEVIEARPERAPDEKVPDHKATARHLLDRANALRVKEKLPPVTEDAKLTASARYFAEYMAWTDRFGHTADGHDPGIRVTAHGYEFGLLGENIGYAFHTNGFTTEALATLFDEGWKGSPGHRANMLDPDVTEAGIAVARSKTTGYYYAVQLFGRPSSRSVIVEVANRTEGVLSYRFAGQAYTLPAIDGRIHEQGRPTELVIELTVGGNPSPRTFKVEPGKSRFVVTEDQGGVQIKRE